MVKKANSRLKIKYAKIFCLTNKHRYSERCDYPDAGIICDISPPMTQYGTCFCKRTRYALWTVIWKSMTDVYVTLTPKTIPVCGYPHKHDKNGQNIKFVCICWLIASHFMFWTYQWWKKYWCGWVVCVCVWGGGGGGGSRWLILSHWL